MCGLEVITAFETDIWPPGLWTHEQKCLVMSQRLVLCSQEVDATVVGLFANLFSVTSLVLL